MPFPSWMTMLHWLDTREFPMRRNKTTATVNRYKLIWGNNNGRIQIHVKNQPQLIIIIALELAICDHSATQKIH
jgi:hypothetical protein